MRPLTILRPALLLALLLPSCGGGGGAGEPASGVQHLDLRLADGSSPSAALAEALPTLAARPVAGDPKSLEPWRVAGGRLQPGQPDGVRLVPAADEAARLVLDGPLDATRYTTLELVAHAAVPVEVRVAWRTDAGEDAITLPVDPGERARRVEFALAAFPSWTGTLRELTVTPEKSVAARLSIHTLRLMPLGFAWGAEPLDEQHAAMRSGSDSRGELGGGRGDAGLRGTGRMTRRAWPADLDVPLFATVERAPRGAVLATAVAPSLLAIANGETTFAAIDVRPAGAGEGAWERRTVLEVPPQRGTWSRIGANLEDFAGEAIELRFTASAIKSERATKLDANRPPREEHLLWGAPEILGELPQSRRPNLVLVTLDTTRADALGAGDPAFAPFLARLGEEALVFTDAWAACNATSPSHASLLTGLSVEEHGVTSNRHLLAPELLTLPEALRAAGYHTAAAVSVPHIQAGTGFGQGFDEFAQAPPGAEVDGAIAIDAVERMLAEWKTLPDRPFFLWVHLFDPHTPYMPPKEFVDDFLARTGMTPPPRKADPPTMPVYVDDPRSLDEIPYLARWGAGVSSLESVRFSYKLGVAYADHLCERLYNALDGAASFDDTAFLLTADHGESLGEHDVWFDHAGLFRETLAVPLVMRLPGGRDGGRKVRTRSTGLDVVPTLRALAGLRPLDGLGGADLRDLAREDGGSADRRVFFAFSDMHQVGFHDGRAHFFTTLTDRLRLGTKLVVDENGKTVPQRGDPIPKGKNFLYDPTTDPALVHDVSDERPEQTRSAEQLLSSWRAKLERRSAERREVSAEEEQNLRNMGYTGD